MKLKFFDFEVLTNWWLCVFGDYPEDGIITEEIKDSFVHVDSDMPNCRDLLMSLFREPNICVVGYNIKYYDLMIANAIYCGLTPQEVKIVNDLIINPSLQFSSKTHMRLFPYSKRKLKGVVYQDLLDDNDGSLKEKEAILGLDIQESKVDFNKEVLSVEDKVDLLYYCKHDVYACMVFHKKVTKGYVNNKLIIGKKFGIPEADCYTNTNANLIGKALGAYRVSFGDEERVDIELHPKIRQYVFDNLPSGVITKVCNSVDKYETKLFGNNVIFSNGGLHSVLSNNLYVEADDEWMLVNVDGTGFYPGMLDELQLLSRCVKNPAVFSRIRAERTMLKYKENKTQDEEDSQLANKLVANTTFGASGNKWLSLYDPYQCTKTCRTGQLFLSALANKLYTKINGLQVMQTNTDGVACYLRRADLPLLLKYMLEWSEISGIGMELNEFDKLWQRDVNNYLMLFKKGGLIVEDGKHSEFKKDKAKRKGLWLMDTWEKPGYFLISPLTAFVCQKAAIAWLSKGKDVMETILENEDVQDFCITCKKGPSFRAVVQRMSNGMEVPLFKCNRIIATNDESLGSIYKIKMFKGTASYHKMPNVPEHCKTMNKCLDDYKFEEVKKDLDYMFYVTRTLELLDINWIPVGKAAKNKDLNIFKYMI